MKIKRLFLSVISLTFVIFLFYSITVYTVQPDSAAPVPIDLNESSAENFARNEINKIIEMNDPLCTWSKETELGIPVALYDCDDVCNGYVYKLYTNAEETGYMQVNYFNGELCAYCYSFAGIPAYEGLATDGIGTAYRVQDNKLYFFGNMTYCVKENDGFRAIDDVNEIKMDTVKAYYQEFLNEIYQKHIEYENERAEPEIAESNSVRTIQQQGYVSTNNIKKELDAM